MSDSTLHPFAVASLERRAEVRLSPDWADAALADADSRFVLAHGTQLLVRRAPSGIAFVGPTYAAVVSTPPERLTLLGWYHGRRCVLVDLEAPALLPEAEWSELRPLLGQISAEESALAICARALLVWHARQRYCGVCGARTVARQAGHVLECTNDTCRSQFFPRIDPAIIVLVTDGDHALLGRQPSWPPGRYSALAGFVEAGECLEEAVAREVEEETGVRVQGMRYFASQPWPFPASLMLGFHATAARGAVRLNGELEDARWFSAEELKRAAAALLPPPHTIARRLIERWFEQLA